MKKKTILPEELGSGTVELGMSPLTVTFPNEDLNKLVEKINEIIKHLNGSI